MISSMEAVYGCKLLPCSVNSLHEASVIADKASADRYSNQYHLDSRPPNNAADGIKRLGGAAKSLA